MMFYAHEYDRAIKFVRYASFLLFIKKKWLVTTLQIQKQ